MYGLALFNHHFPDLIEFKSVHILLSDASFQQKQHFLAHKQKWQCEYTTYSPNRQKRGSLRVQLFIKIGINL